MRSAADLLYRCSRIPVLDAMTTTGMLGVDRRARAEALRSLVLIPGEHVLELACGTGRLLPRLAVAVGPQGRVVGVDASQGLLRRAHARTAALTNVELRCESWPSNFSGPVDAAICVLGLSVIDQWVSAFNQLLHVVRPGGRIAIVDQFTDRARTGPLATYVRFAGRVAGADPEREVEGVGRTYLAGASTRSFPLGVRLIHGFVANA